MKTYWKLVVKALQKYLARFFLLICFILIICFNFYLFWSPWSWIWLILPVCFILKSAINERPCQEIPVQSQQLDQDNVNGRFHNFFDVNFEQCQYCWMYADLMILACSLTHPLKLFIFNRHKLKWNKPGLYWTFYKISFIGVVNINCKMKNCSLIIQYTQNFWFVLG